LPSSSTNSISIKHFKQPGYFLKLKLVSTKMNKTHLSKVTFLFFLFKSAFQVVNTLDNHTDDHHPQIKIIILYSCSLTLNFKHHITVKVQVTFICFIEIDWNTSKVSFKFKVVDSNKQSTCTKSYNHNMMSIELYCSLLTTTGM
jgi:hypothetical protein